MPYPWDTWRGITVYDRRSETFAKLRSRLEYERNTVICRYKSKFGILIKIKKSSIMREFRVPRCIIKFG
jgi:hypothetical protein